MANQVAVVNYALELIAAQTTITSLGDGTPAGDAAAIVYAPIVQMLCRELDPDFCRFTAPLVLSGAETPVVPWAYEYVYPVDCLRARQVRPPSGVADPNDPQPIRWVVAFDVIPPCAPETRRSMRR